MGLSCRLALYNEGEIGVALHVNTKQQAFRRIDLQRGRRPRLEPGQRPDSALDDFDPRHSIGRQPFGRRLVVEGVILDRQRLRVVKANAPGDTVNVTAM